MKNKVREKESELCKKRRQAVGIQFCNATLELRAPPLNVRAHLQVTVDHVRRVDPFEAAQNLIDEELNM